MILVQNEHPLHMRDLFLSGILIASLGVDFIAIEMIRGIAGIMGILFAVPCVSAATAMLPTKNK